MSKLQEDLDEIKAMWANGNYTGPEQSQTIQLNSNALGSVHAIGTILDSIEEDFGVEEVVDYGH